MPKRLFTQDELSTAVQMYEAGAGYKEIGAVINIHPKNVGRTIRRAGFEVSRRSRPTYSINETFFDTWTANSAYVVGYFVADGAFEVGNTFRLYSNDLPLLVAVSNAMNLVRTPAGPHGNTYRLDINSKKLTARLAEIVGTHGSKVGQVRLPQVPDFVRRDLLRGLFDGDGHVGSKPQRGAPTVKYTNTSQLLLEDVRDALNAMGITVGNPYVVPLANPLHKTRYDLEFRNAEVMRRFYNLLYSHNPDLFLARKKERFERYLELGI